MWSEHTDLRAARYLSVCNVVDLVHLLESLATEGSNNPTTSFRSLPRIIIDILQEQDASASVLLELEGKLECERFCRYWTSEYGRWTHSNRQSNLEMQCCEDAPAAAKAFSETQQAVLRDLRDWTPAEMIRVVAAYWSRVSIQATVLRFSCWQMFNTHLDGRH